MITAPAFITQVRNSYGPAMPTEGPQQHQPYPLSQSEASMCLEPAIISQSGLNKSTLQHKEPIVNLAQILPKRFLKLFLAR